MTVSLLAQYRIYDEYPTYPDFRQLSSTRPLINQPRPARPFKRLENLLLAAVADIDLALIDGGAGGEGGHTPDFLGVGEGLAGGGFGGEGCGWGPCGEVSEGGAAAEGEAWDVHCDLFFFFFFCEGYLWRWMSYIEQLQPATCYSTIDQRGPNF